MKKFYNTLPILLISLFVSCSNDGNKEKKNSNESPIRTTQRNLDLRNPQGTDYDACDCNKRSQKIIDKTITFRLKFDSMVKLKQDQESKKQIRKFAKEYIELVKKCFEINNAQLMVESECNNLKLLQAKKDSLRRLGIQIEQGESVRL